MKQNFFVYIPFVNREDLLSQAVQSIHKDFQRIIIVDNSEEGLPVGHFLKCEVLRPSVSLTFSQTQNFMRKFAMRQGVRWFAFMHNDAEALEKTGQKLIEMVGNQETLDWGCIFTNYDTLCAYNTEMSRVVGEWDTNLPQYFADDDYYRRIRLAGFKVLESNLPVEHHGASNTIRSDEKRLLLNGATFPLYQQYYQKKWGAPPKQEVFNHPFNRPDLFQIKSIITE